MAKFCPKKQELGASLFFFLNHPKKNQEEFFENLEN
ncbi:MAG: hypothetical protein ACJAT4_003268 [Granulosicoccus sp.]